MGRLSSTVNPAGIALTYTYSAVGQCATLSQPSGLFTYVYDPARRISTLTNPESQVTSWLYDGASRVTANLLANGVTVPYTYDHANRILLLAYLTSAAQHFRASTTPTTASAIEPGLLKRMEMSSPGLMIQPIG